MSLNSFNRGFLSNDLSKIPLLWNNEINNNVFGLVVTSGGSTLAPMPAWRGYTQEGSGTPTLLGSTMTTILDFDPGILRQPVVPKMWLLSSTVGEHHTMTCLYF